MGIPSKYFLAEPYNDNKMRYDFIKHLYVLEVDKVKAEGIDLVRLWGSKENAEAILELLSTNIYAYILSYKDSKYRDEMLYYLSHSSKVRSDIYEILIDGCWYLRQEAGMMIAYTHGINLLQSKEVKIGLENIVSIIGEQKIKNTDLANRILRYDIEVEDSEIGKRW